MTHAPRNQCAAPARAAGPQRTRGPSGCGACRPPQRAGTPPRGRPAGATTGNQVKGLKGGPASTERARQGHSTVPRARAPSRGRPAEGTAKLAPGTSEQGLQRGLGGVSLAALMDLLQFDDRSCIKWLQLLPSNCSKSITQKACKAPDQLHTESGILPRLSTNKAS